ncbi:MAG: hypothetical protein K8R99_14155 [Actinomycetia bacterium]|nr:hypothetical protein [Actinomycetes bacterium]
MTALPGVRRKRTALILAMSVVALVAVGALGLVGANALRHYEGAKKLDNAETIPLAVTSVGMLAITDDTGRLAGVTLVVSLPGDLPGGYVLPVPTSVDSTLVTGDERIALTAVFAQEGIDGLALAVEGALSVTLNSSQAVTPAEAEALLAPVAPVQAQLPLEVRDTVDGAAVVLFPAGAAELTAAQVVQVLTAEVSGEHESARRDNINAVWAGIAAAVGAGKTQWVVGTPAVTVADLLTRAFAGTVSSQSFPTVPIAAELNPAALDVEQIDRAEAVMWLAAVAPGSMSAPGLGLTYRVEAPPGYVEQVKAAIAVLLSIGANVKSVDFNGPVLPTSLALLSTEDESTVVTTDLAAFGTVAVSVNPLPIEGIDVVLRLGSDYLDGVPLAVPTTTSASTSTTLLP